MKPTSIPVVKRPLFWWVFSGDLKLQILLMVVITAAVAARVLPLELQKRIINETIKQSHLKLLFIYCGVYLLAVLIAGGLKYAINVLQTLLSQQATAEMREQLYDYMLGLPTAFFKRTQPGMVVSSLVNELAVTGDFVGQALAVPVTNILTLVVLTGYLLWLNPLLAAASLVVHPFVALLLPMLQRRTNELNRRRINQARELSGKITDTVGGLSEIQAHGTRRFETHKFADNVKILQITRVRWNLYRYGTKALINFVNNFSPFIIFMLGGYLAVKGRLDLGALVAFISAQEKLFNPLTELIDFFQDYQDAAVSYRRTMESFDVTPDYPFEPAGRPARDLQGGIQVRDLSYTTPDGIRLLEGITLSVEDGEQIALVGPSGSGKSTLVQCIGQLTKHTGGSISIGGADLSSLTRMDVVRNVG